MTSIRSDKTTSLEAEYFRFLDLLRKEKKVRDKTLAGSGCCLICYNNDPLELEEHHIAGRKNSDITITVCGSHHAKLSRMQGSTWEKAWDSGLKVETRLRLREAILFRGLSDVASVKCGYLMSKAVLG